MFVSILKKNHFIIFMKYLKNFQNLNHFLTPFPKPCSAVPMHTSYFLNFQSHTAETSH